MGVPCLRPPRCVCLHGTGGRASCRDGRLTGREREHLGVQYDAISMDFEQINLVQLGAAEGCAVPRVATIRTGTVVPQ